MRNNQRVSVCFVTITSRNKDNFLAVQQFASWPARVARNCTLTEVAKYNLKWSKDCVTAQVDAIIEPCRLREALYNSMQFSPFFTTT